MQNPRTKIGGCREVTGLYIYRDQIKRWRKVETGRQGGESERMRGEEREKRGRREGEERKKKGRREGEVDGKRGKRKGED